MIRQNRHIKGILIQKNFVCFNIRIIQLCFLDGTEKSLKSALDLLFQFSKFSGLDAKAQGHWIGSKLGNKDILCFNFKKTIDNDDLNILATELNSCLKLL